MARELQQMMNSYFGMVRQVSWILDFEEKNVTVEEARILEFVEIAQECTMSDLSKKFRMPASTATRIIDRFVLKSLLKRKRSDTDRRIVLLSVSKRGIQVLKIRAERRNKYFTKMFSKLSSKDITNLHSIFQKLIIDQEVS